jgi:predicted outer membrane repeat protein
MKSRQIAKLLVPVLAACAVAFCLGPTASGAEACDSPAPLPVPASSAVVGDGSAQSCTESALDAAAAKGGRVTFACGSAVVTIPVTRTISVTKTTVIDGAGKVTLVGGGANRILQVPNGTSLSVRNLRFVKGAAAQSSDRAIGSGGAVSGGYRSHIEVISSSFEGNSAGLGGGAVSVGTDSTLSIVGSTFHGNSSWYGGAVYSLLSQLTVVDSTFTGNSTTTGGGMGDGGAIGTDGASPIAAGGKGGVIRVCGSTFTGNAAHGSGGGVYLWAYVPDRIIVERDVFKDNVIKPNDGGGVGLGGGARLSIGPTQYAASGGSVAVEGTSLVSNSGGDGGGLYLDCIPTCTISNSTFYGNSATAFGGAIMGDGHHDANVTFADNTAGSHGGALFGKNFVLDNSVFVGNAAHNPWGQAMTCSSTGTGSHVLQWLTSGRDGSTPCVAQVIAVNPLLAPPADTSGSTLTMMPAANSPVLNAGAGCEPIDQLGSARSVSRCDLGAVQRSSLVHVVGSPTSVSPTSVSPTSVGTSPTTANSHTGAASTVSVTSGGDAPVRTSPTVDANVSGILHSISAMVGIALTAVGVILAAVLVAWRVVRQPRGTARQSQSHARR